jgi:hypothetical protein
MAIHGTPTKPQVLIEDVQAIVDRETVRMQQSNAKSLAMSKKELFKVCQLHVYRLRFLLE